MIFLSFFLSFFLSLCYADSEYMYAGCAVLGFGVSVVRKKNVGMEEKAFQPCFERGSVCTWISLCHLMTDHY